jgi:hypothetical protein
METFSALVNYLPNEMVTVLHVEHKTVKMYIKYKKMASLLQNQF